MSLFAPGTFATPQQKKQCAAKTGYKFTEPMIDPLGTLTNSESVIKAYSICVQQATTMAKISQKKYIFLQPYTIDTIINGIPFIKQFNTGDIITVTEHRLPSGIKGGSESVVITTIIDGKQHNIPFNVVKVVKEYMKPEIKFIFTKDFQSQGRGKRPEQSVTMAFTPFKKGEIIEGVVTDNTPVDGGKFVTFEKNGLIYIITLPYSGRGGMVDSPLVEFTPNAVPIQKDNNSVTKPKTSPTTYFTPKNIIIGVGSLLVLLGILKITKVI